MLTGGNTGGQQQDGLHQVCLHQVLIPHVSLTNHIRKHNGSTTLRRTKAIRIAKDSIYGNMIRNLRVGKQIRNGLAPKDAFACGALETEVATTYTQSVV
jgi:hypothetical protein